MKFNAQQNGYITEINTFPLKICGREKALHKNSLQKTKAAHCFQVKQKRKNPVKRFTQAMAALSHVLLESLICGFSLRPKDAESYHLLAHLRTPGPSVAITLHTKQDPPLQLCKVMKRTLAHPPKARVPSYAASFQNYPG